MARLKNDYRAYPPLLDVLDSPADLEAVIQEAEALELPNCPFCGGEAEVKMGTTFTRFAVHIECSRCHCNSLRSAAGIVYPSMTAPIMVTPINALRTTAWKWSRREAATA